MAVGAPTDPLFYADLDDFATRCGLRAEDALFIWNSESGLDNTLDVGGSRTYSTLMHNIVVPRVMDQATWDRLPQMTHREQLPLIEKAVFTYAHAAIGGRNFKSTFEVYLANAAPGLLRPDGIYDDMSPMYVGSNYPDNWTMERTDLQDQYTMAAINGFSAWYAQQKQLKTGKHTLRDAYPVAVDLVSKGQIKGFVSLGDLRQFAKRLSAPGTAARKPFDDAVIYLNNVRANVKAGLAPSITPPPTASTPSTTQPASATDTTSYTPDMDSQFAVPGSHIDTRVASPSVAHSVAPKSATPGAKKLTSQASSIKQFVAAGSIAGLVIGIVTAVAHSKKG